jgi:glycosyltransferase involved in cell wall biosynthesis
MTVLSIVTPCYNEEAGITECYEEVRAVMEAELPEFGYEHIFIDNCSQDRTVTLLRAIAATDKRVKIIVNSRNFGPARSPFHAILQSKGDATIPMLADLQTPPALIPKMVRLWLQGAKVVVALKRRSDERMLWRFARDAYYKTMKSLSKIEQLPNFIGYGLYDRCVVDAMRALKEPEPYFRGLVMEVGFERATVEYDQPLRRHGRSSYNLFSLADYALVGLSSYSRAPLRLMTFLGFFVSTLSFFVGLVYLIFKLVFWNSLPIGVAPVLISIFFLGSIQLFALGVVGEYIGLLLNYARQFPLVIEKERINFD